MAEQGWPRLRMLMRPYAQTARGPNAFFWLLREGSPDGRGDVLARGEGHAGRELVERHLRQLAGGTSPDSGLAAEAMLVGWERRP